MSTRERILTIRLMEMVKRQPAYVEAIGIETALDTGKTDLVEDPP